MKKTLLLALALGVFAGCADDSPDVVETDTVVVEPAVPVTEPTDDLMMDDTLAVDTETMEMDGEMIEGDAGLDETMDDEGME